jgi:ubiquinone/menaquinone biosynthesis C-methylase UbiE
MKKEYVQARPIDSWEAFWRSESVEENIRMCEGDALLSVFKDYLRKDQRILEAGCGLAKWVIYLGREGYQLYGLDNCMYSLERAKAFDGDLKLIRGTILQLPVPDNSVDTYISLGVIEHFEEGPDEALKEAYRVLRPGGVAIIETPLNNILRRLFPIKHWYWTSLRLFRRMRGYEYSFADYLFTTNELEQYIRQAGFTILETRPEDFEMPWKSIGLWLDFNFLHKRGGALFELNRVGCVAKRFFDKLSPWVSCGCVTCVATK